MGSLLEIYAFSVHACYLILVVFWVFYHIHRSAKWYGIHASRRPPLTFTIEKKEYVYGENFVNFKAMHPIKCAYMIALGTIVFLPISLFWIIIVPGVSFWSTVREARKKDLEEHS